MRTSTFSSSGEAQLNNALDPSSVSPCQPLPSENISRVPQLERWLAIGFFVLIAVLKIGYVRHFRIDSDEPQHLHVVWGWTQGMVQYRDYFDNHTPIFQLLCAPLLKWLGERSDILIPMRVAMVPLFAGMLWCVYRLGCGLYGRRTGMWAAVLTALYPVFMLTSTEFRTDDLWVLAWLVSLVIAFGRPMTGRRILATGLAMGFTYGVSMKTSLLMAALLFAWLLILVLRVQEEGRKPLRHSGRYLLLFLAGLCVVPLLLTLFFWSQGALERFFYCAVEHNATPGLGNWSKQAYRQLIFPAVFPLLMAGAIAIYRAGEDRQTGSRRAVLFLTAGLFLAALESYWPLLTSQDFMPVVPLFAVALTPMLLAAGRKIAEKFSFPVCMGTAGLLLACGALEIVLMQKQASVFVDRVSGWNRSLENVLKLTRPDDYVMDGKGETIFRKRPCYWVLEGITLARMRMGLIPNTIISDIVSHKTCVAMTTRLPIPALNWMRRHFVPVSERVYVTGAMLKGVEPNQSVTFKLAIPAFYQIIASNGPVVGQIDGNPYSGRVFLDAGKHTFCYKQSGDVAVVWSQAVERGFSPFHLAPEFHANKNEL